MNISSTNHLFNTIAQLHMPDDERATLQAAITSSLAQLATPIPVPHKPQKPTSYNGKVDAISSLNFIESLEEYFQIVELPAEKWVPYAIGYLGEARAWWRGTKRNIHNTPWIDFRSIFLRQFTPADSVNAARRRLHALKQGSGPVLDYITTFNDLLRIIPEMDGGHTMYMFINGLERELSKQVRLARPSDLEDAIMNATILYDVLNQNEPTINTTSTPKTEPMEIDTIYTALNAILRNNITTSSTNRYRNNNNRPFNNIRTNTNNNNNNNNNNNDNNRHYTPYTRSSTNPPNPPRLDYIERERCMRLGLCLRCRQPGHLAHSCPIFRLNVMEVNTSETHTFNPDLAIGQQSGNA
jgi:hypothetical protein